MSKAIESATEKGISRGELIRDTAVFQVKLALDGILDFFMVPVSLVGAVISFFSGKRTFYDLVHSGHNMDRKIDLFRVAKRFESPEAEDRIEQLARRLEAEIRREYDEGHLRASAKSTIDRLLRAVRNRGEDPG